MGFVLKDFIIPLIVAVSAGVITHIVCTHYHYDIWKRYVIPLGIGIVLGASVFWIGSIANQPGTIEEEITKIQNEMEVQRNDIQNIYIKIKNEKTKLDIKLIQNLHQQNVTSFNDFVRAFRKGEYSTEEMKGKISETEKNQTDLYNKAKAFYSI